MKKRKFILVIAFSAALLALTIKVGYYYFITLSFDELKSYCVENSYRSATEFKRMGNYDNPVTYSFWVAGDGDNSKGQELYVFYPKTLLNIDLTRFVDFKHSSELLNGTQKNVGMLYFTPRDQEGRKSPVNSIVFFSSNTAKKKINKYSITYRITENGKSKEEAESSGLPLNPPFIVFAKDLGTIDGVKKECIKAAFFFEDGTVADEFLIEQSEPTVK